MRKFKTIEKKAAESENQYTLSLAIAKRIRHIRSGAPTFSSIPNPSENPVDAAFEEFADSQITFSAQGAEEGVKDPD